MFAVILNLSISVVKQELQAEESVYGLTNVVADSVKNVVGMFVSTHGKDQYTQNLKSGITGFGIWFKRG